MILLALENLVVIYQLSRWRERRGIEKDKIDFKTSLKIVAKGQTVNIPIHQSGKTESKLYPDKSEVFHSSKDVQWVYIYRMHTWSDNFEHSTLVLFRLID